MNPSEIKVQPPQPQAGAQNRLSQIAFRFYAAGMTGDEVEIPERYSDFVEVFDLPEKPEGWEFKTRKPTKSIVVPVSGGLDSTLCYLMAKQTGMNVIPLYFDIGQPYSAKEIQALKDLSIRAIIVRLNVPDAIKNGKWSAQWKHIIPARNFLFLSTAAEFLATEGYVYFGALDGEIKERLGGDKSRKFVEIMNDELSKMPFPAELVMPLEKFDKPQAIAHAINELKIPVEYLVRTLSCFDGKDNGHCGKCQACFRRFMAFYANGVDLRNDDDFGFTSDIIENTKEYQEKYAKLMGAAMESGDFSQYSKQRCETTLKVLGDLGLLQAN